MNAQPAHLAFDLPRDLRVLRAMASHLTPYLYEKDLFGHLPGDLPRLTVGGLLLRLYRLERLGALLDSDQQAAFEEARRQFEAERAVWAVHYVGKLHQEFNARLKAFGQFFQDYAEDPQGSAANYPVEAEKRTIMTHLLDELAAQGEPVPDVSVTCLARYDGQLRRLLRGDEFVFDPQLLAVYPRQRFWWLYGVLG